MWTRAKVVLAAGALAACGRADFTPQPDAGRIADADAARATWTLGQVVSVALGHQIEISATAGDLLVLDVDVGNVVDRVVSVVDTTGDVFVMVPNGTQDLGSDLGFTLFYREGASAGLHTITVTMATGDATTLVAWDVAGIATSGALDTSIGMSSTGALAANAETPQLTTSIRGEFVLAVATLGATLTGLTPGSPFTIDSMAGGDAFSHLTDASASVGVYQAVWEQNPAGVFCSAIAGFLTAR